LFQPFSQLDSSPSRGHGGSGLGLAICRGLVEQMGGTIAVTSEPGEGSTFSVTLPLEKARASRTPDQPHDRNLMGRCVLAVDDNPTNRELLSAHLESAGILCDTAQDGDTALSLLQLSLATRPYELVIVDHRMPGMSGYELVRRIRADRRFDRLKVMVLGSVGRSLSAGEAEALGIAAFATKPIWRKLLLRTIRDLFAPKAAADATVAGAEPPRTGKHLLLVEDSDINAEVAGEFLRRGGYTFEVVTDGQQAVDAVQARPFDLILMDCQLPVLDGYESTLRIRALEAQGALPGGKQSPVPIIALTASVLKEDIDRVIASGMQAHVPKPFHGPRLLATIAAALGAPPEEEAASAAPSVWNGARSLERLGGNAELLAKIIEQFKAAAEEAKAELTRAVADADAKAVSFLVHRMTPHALMFDADALSSALKELSRSARAQAWAEAGLALARVVTELDRLCEALSG
jgi:CheY-like chemotaxis protein/HPt (histidine-containing phosphotransfer) domain-containing protein